MPESAALIVGRLKYRPKWAVKRRDAMLGPREPKSLPSTSPLAGPTRRAAVGLVLGGPLLGACAGMSSLSNPFSSDAAPAGPPQQPQAVGTGGVKVGLVLPLSASGNAGVAALSMKNAAEMALAEFQNPNIQLLIKDDAGSPQGASQGTQQALDEGAEILLGPIFAHSVSPVGQTARSRNVPVVAFSTDANVATRGVYLLSFLPESDVDRVVSYAISQGKKSFAAAIPDNAYGSVAEAAFKQSVARRGGRVVAPHRGAVVARWSCGGSGPGLIEGVPHDPRTCRGARRAARLCPARS